MAPPLRFLTYLAPGIPLALFEWVAGRLAVALGRAVELRAETASSGPAPGAADPFSTGDADVGFVCAPALLRLRRHGGSPVAVVPAAPVFDDPRGAGRPVYFADVVVRASASWRDLRDMRGVRWAYNDPCSLSGYWSLFRRLAELRRDPATALGALQHAGSHLASLEHVADGRADAAAVDSTTLAMLRRDAPARLRGLRVLETWGPYAVQPVVVRRALGEPLRRSLARALRALPRTPADRRRCRALGLRGFARIDHRAYERERRGQRAAEAVARRLKTGLGIEPSSRLV